MKKILCVVLCAAMLCSVAALFAGCGNAGAGEVNVYNWGEYISEGQDGLMNVIDEFEKETGIKVNYTTFETNEDLYNMLKNSILVLAQASPIFHSSCEGKLGIALE